MQGISFITDAYGRKVKAVVDLSIHGRAFVEFLTKLQSSAPVVTNPSSPTTTTTTINTSERQIKANTIIQKARSFLGVPHVMGGVSMSGIDCSGLTMVSFLDVGIRLPRVAGDQAAFGKQIPRNQVVAGDLIFFATNAQRPNYIAHVGLILDKPAANGAIYFIHASSRGVMESFMSAGNYWEGVYLQSVRIF